MGGSAARGSRGAGLVPERLLRGFKEKVESAGGSGGWLAIRGARKTRRRPGGGSFGGGEEMIDGTVKRGAEPSCSTPSSFGCSRLPPDAICSRSLSPTTAPSSPWRPPLLKHLRRSTPAELRRAPSSALLRAVASPGRRAWPPAPPLETNSGAPCLASPSASVDAASPPASPRRHQPSRPHRGQQQLLQHPLADAALGPPPRLAFDLGFRVPWP
nr:WAS/WASL-interacting protein family member 1-like [Aegilops tauschii subsp. strangulata]